MSDEAPTTPERITEFDAHLVAPLTYAFEGSNHQASFIRFFAPSSKVSRECAALKQAFMRAVPTPTAAQVEAARMKEGKQELPTGPEIVAVMMASTDVDYPDVLDVARKLFLSPGIAKVDGEVKLTRNLLDQVDGNDFEEMLGVYMANFTMPSVLSKTS